MSEYIVLIFDCIPAGLHWHMPNQEHLGERGSKNQDGGHNAQSKPQPFCIAHLKSRD